MCRAKTTSTHELMKNLVLASMDASRLDIRELFIDFAWAVGEISATISPVPEYLESAEVSCEIPSES